MKKTLVALLLSTLSLLGCAASPFSPSLQPQPAPAALAGKSVSTGPSLTERAESSIRKFDQSLEKAQR